MGAPEELYELPKTAFVANFLGQSNLFTGDVTNSKGDSIVVDIPGVKIEVPKDRAQRHTGEITIGVRPRSSCCTPKRRRRRRASISSALVG